MGVRGEAEILVPEGVRRSPNDLRHLVQRRGLATGDVRDEKQVQHGVLDGAVGVQIGETGEKLQAVQQDAGFLPDLTRRGLLRRLPPVHEAARKGKLVLAGCPRAPDEALVWLDSFRHRAVHGKRNADGTFTVTKLIGNGQGREAGPALKNAH